MRTHTNELPHTNRYPHRADARARSRLLFIRGDPSVICMSRSDIKWRLMIRTDFIQVLKRYKEMIITYSLVRNQLIKYALEAKNLIEPNKNNNAIKSPLSYLQYNKQFFYHLFPKMLLRTIEKLLIRDYVLCRKRSRLRK